MRALKVLVIAMGIAILIATTVLVTVIIQRGARLAEAPSVGGGPASAQTGDSVAPARRLVLPPGASVQETRLADDRIVLRARLAGGGDAVFVFDSGTGGLIARYDIVGDGTLQGAPERATQGVR